MGNIILILILVIIAISAINSTRKRFKGGCCGGGGETLKFKPADRNLSHYPYRAIAYIDSMTCDHCKTRIENAFNGTDGCTAKVNLKSKYADIRSKSPLSEDFVSKIITKAGYSLTNYKEL